MSIGLTFALRFSGAVGGAVLAAAAVATVVGEIVGPASLRAWLRRAGEIPDAAAATDDGAIGHDQRPKPRPPAEATPLPRAPPGDLDAPLPDRASDAEVPAS
jgi:hypothetical protein